MEMEMDGVCGECMCADWSMIINKSYINDLWSTIYDLVMINDQSAGKCVFVCVCKCVCVSLYVCMDV